MRRVLRERSTKVAIAVSVALGAGLSTSRLLGVHGVESALVLGILLPPFAGCAGAGLVCSARRRGADPTARALLTSGWDVALLTWGPATALLALNQLRVRQCSPGEGLAFMLLGPLPGILLAAWVGILVATATRCLPRTFATLIPLLWIAKGLVEFWSTPAIFVFGHFAGWFPGTLYDEDIALPSTFWSFRALTCLWLVAVAASLMSWWRRGRGRLGRPRRLSAVIALCSVGLALLGELFGPSLGHRSSIAAIDDALGTRARGERCVVHAPRELPRSTLARLRRDCDFRVARAEALLGVVQPEPVHAFFYRSAAEKQRWMGAGRTYIAKPWRSEVHLQMQAWPHRVLAHEVVHVVAGNAAKGPFRVAGGWLPNPGWIEGVAVAVEWPSADGMNPHQYMKALRELERLPPIGDVMSLRFLALPPRVAYSAAGSFVAFLLERHGADAVRRAHRDASLASLGSEAELEARWHTFLDEQVLPEGALALAELRFARASIFASVCPHRVARLQAELAGDLAAGDERRAIHTCREILAIEPGAVGARAALVGALARNGRVGEARREIAALEGAPPPLIDRARERLADALWLHGKRREALAYIEALLERPQTEAEARSREVKALALRSGGRTAEILREILVGSHGRGISAPEVVHLTRELSELRQDGLGAYLEARQLLFQDRYDRVIPLVANAQEQGLPTARLLRESQRMEAIARYAEGDLEGAAELWRAAQQDPLLRHEANDWLARIAHERSHVSSM